jgi:hypothetical protein
MPCYFTPNFKETKKQAMHAAAARALDCFSLRDPDGTKTAVQLCEDAPYLSMEAPTIPMLPDEIKLPIKLITPANE